MAFTWEMRVGCYDLLHNDVIILTLYKNLTIIHTYGCFSREQSYHDQTKYFQLRCRDHIEMYYYIMFGCKSLLIPPFEYKSEYRLPVHDFSGRKSDNLDYETKVLELSMILKYKYDNIEKSIKFTRESEIRIYNFDKETYELTPHLVLHKSDIGGHISAQIIEDKLSRFISAFVNTKPSNVKRAIN